jgi:peptide/nickel transport system substrate-binding protein
MKQKTIWLVLSIITVLLMVLVSCKSTGTTEEEKGTTVTGKVTEVQAVTEKPPEYKAEEEKPEYGGTFTYRISVDILGFDEAYTAHYNTYATHLTNEELLADDWTRGPAGTGEFDFHLPSINRLDIKAGVLAESWEIPQKGTMIFHIRHGIKWQNKPPVSGRELTAADIVYSLKRYCTAPRSYIKLSYPAMSSSIQITADGDYTVVMTCPEAEFGNMASMLPDFASIIPHEVVEQYGDMQDWRNSCGTGPYMLTDFVSGGSATLKRNPTYWGKDTAGPGKGMQLPYLDTVSFLVIPDASVAYTAVRTGKADWCEVTWDEAAKMRQTNPELNWTKFIHDTVYIQGMRTDKADSPFSNLKVRQALALATDFKKLRDVFYGGDAEIMCWPVVTSKEYAGSYLSLEQYPADVQELFSYNPTKAKQLLQEAGYPALKVNWITYNSPVFVDTASQYKAMWAEAGIDVTIDAREYSVWTTLMSTRNYGAYDLLCEYTAGIGTAWKMINFNGASMFNISYINDATVQAAYTKIQALVGIDEKSIDTIFRELLPYLVKQCYVVYKPTAYYYLFWSPWVKNYYGQLASGYYNYFDAPKYIWIDQSLRK